MKSKWITKMKKWLLIIVIVLIGTITCYIVCNKQYGKEKSLGQGIVLTLWDTEHSWRLIKCYDEGLFGCSIAENLIPYQIQKYAYNEKWIILYSKDPYYKYEAYWIVEKYNDEKKYQIKKHIIGPLNKEEFEILSKKLKIGLRLKAIDGLQPVRLPPYEYMYPSKEERELPNYRHNITHSISPDME
ncbi:hypothetical protein [Sulfurovum sp.]|uniref:hypothetical protein n=1 Tax=Sulfurovum sp. TaxID=1969726 RepID=UPI00356547CB